MPDSPEARRLIATRIVEAFGRVGLSKAAFCRAVGISAPTFHRWEKAAKTPPEELEGKGNVPSVFNLFDVARLTGTSMEWLMGGADEGGGEVLAEWIRVHRPPPEAQAFLEALPLLGRRPTPLFYKIALVAWEEGLTVDEAAQAAAVTEQRARRRQSG